MTKVAVIYGTTEGQTAKVAQHLAQVGREAGFEVDVLHAAELGHEFDLDRYDGVLVGGSLHEGHMQRYLERWIKDHAAWLSAHPSALFCVCLAAASTHPEERAEAEAIMDRLLAHSGFRPTHRTLVAGALRYTQYNWLKRTIMKHIAAKEGGATDTSRDHEYTDWRALTAWAQSFLAQWSAAQASRASSTPSS